MKRTLFLTLGGELLFLIGMKGDPPFALWIGWTLCTLKSGYDAPGAVCSRRFHSCPGVQIPR